MTRRYHPLFDWIIMDLTGVYWPGAMSWRSEHSWRGYRSLAEAEARIRAIEWAYNGKYGKSPGNLRVYARYRGVVQR